MATTIPALSVPYGKSSYWDELKQKKAQGYTVPDKQALALAYGERYGELANEMNRQRVNRQIETDNARLALDEYRTQADVAARNRLYDLNKDTADKSWYGQLTGLGISALLNSDKLIKGGENLWNAGTKAYDWMTNNIPALSDGWQLPEGYDLASDWSNIGSGMIMDEAGNWVPDMAEGGVDFFGDGSMAFAEGAADYSFPYYTAIKYGAKGLNAIAEANDIQQLSNITEPLTGMFDALSTGLSTMVTGIWDNTFGDWL